jgi:hypothetical protein
MDLPAVPARIDPPYRSVKRKIRKLKIAGLKQDAYNNKVNIIGSLVQYYILLDFISADLV